MQDKSFIARTQRYQLAHGITLLVLENHSNATASIFGVLKAGAYFNPPGRYELAGLTASMLNKGTLRRSKLEIAEALESVGARLNFSANTFITTISGQSLSRDFGTILATLAEELREPSFPEDELAKLKQHLIATIKHHQEETRLRAIERLTQILYPPANPFYHPSADELVDEVEQITADEIQQFYQYRYGAASMILAVVGDVAAEDVRGQIEDLLGDWIGAPRAEIDLPVTSLQSSPKREWVPMKDKANVDVVIGHASRLRRANSDYLAATLANHALGHSTLSSRLGLKVRDEMGLTYGINSAFMESGLGDGPFTISVTVAPSNIDPAINASLEIIEDFIRNGIREDELRDEKSSWIGSFKIGLATNSGMAAQLASAELYGLGVNYLDEFARLVSSLTKEEVDEAIRYYFHPECATTVIAGTFD